MLVSPSLLSADFGNLAKDIDMINRSSADMLHLDVMDGVFVPNIWISRDEACASTLLQTARRASHDCGASKIYNASEKLRCKHNDRALRSMHTP